MITGVVTIAASEIPILCYFVRESGALRIRVVPGKYG